MTLSFIKIKKYFYSQRGTALITVMGVMSVVFIIGSLVLYMAAAEIRSIDDFSDQTRAFYIAEAGADLAVKEWEVYVNSLEIYKDKEGSITGIEEADVNSFKSILNSKKSSVVNGFFDKYSNNKIIQLSYLNWKPGTGKIRASEDFLTISIRGVYDQAVCDYQVALWYDKNKNTGSYKGFGEVNIPQEPDQNEGTPRVVNTKPAQGALNVKVNQLIEVGYSDKIYPGDKFNNITLKNNEGKFIELQKVFIANNKLKINPRHRLDYNTVYIVNIPGGALVDDNGNPLSGFTFNFITEKK
ncbi:MAG: Ig-like domain-containing protein [Desulfotomaculum sp.]|nr:Ig-like domain-containing protein [Desulfotomaculum sp.]